MHRQQLLSLVRDYEECYPDETSTVARFREFVERCPDCFERTLEEGHITGSAWIVDRSGDRVLLTHHRKLNLWIQLGGHADGDCDVAAVALREAEEESGLDQLCLIDRIFDLDVHRIPERKSEAEHWHYDVRFLIQHRGKGRFVVSEESHDLAWLKIGEIETVTNEESILRMRRKWLALRNRSTGS